MQDFLQVQHAAELAILAMALRAIHGREHNDNPEVVSLAFRVTPDAIPGLSVIECEALDAHGNAIGGWSL